MNAGGGRPIPELAALYEVIPLMTYDGWEHDVKVEENLWAEGYTTAESIERSVEKMRRRGNACTRATVPMRFCKCSTARRRGLRTLVGSKTLSARRASGWKAGLRLRASN